MQTNETTHRYAPPQQLWPSTPAAIHDARHELLKRLAEWGLSELGDQAGLVLSELMTNAHRHGSVGGGWIGTSFRQAESGVLLEVHDTRGEARPELTTAAQSDESGRGLGIVDAVTDQQWGVSERIGPGKMVWALVPGAVAKPSVLGPGTD